MPRSFQVGLGYGTTEGPHIEAQWTHRNLWRGAEQLTLSTGFSAIEQKIEARLTLPYFLAPRTAFSGTLFVRNQEQLSINQAEQLRRALALPDLLERVQDFAEAATTTPD